MSEKAHRVMVDVNSLRYSSILHLFKRNVHSSFCWNVFGDDDDGNQCENVSIEMTMLN